MTVSTSEISLTLHPRLTNTEGKKEIFVNFAAKYLHEI
jgi:hypothetical protein